MKISLLLCVLFLFTGGSIAQCDPTYKYTVEYKLDTATVTFIANDTTPGLQHVWHYGNLFYGTGPIFTYKFTVPGPYNVVHTIRSASGNCIDSTSDQQLWLDFPVRCDAEFTLIPDSSREGIYVLTPVTFGGTSTQYEITVDGIVGGTTEPHGMFINEGTHEVCLNVKYFDCTARSCKTLIVPPFCRIKASFSYEESSSKPRSFYFKPNLSSPSMKYNWSFGDGSTSIETNPTHEYTRSGEYTVTLKIADSTGICSDITSMQIYVFPVPGEVCNASFTYTGDPANPLRYAFTTQSNEQIIYQRWHFVSRDSAHVFETEEFNPMHVFPGPGSYFVLLELTTSTGCKDRYWAEINILPGDPAGDNAIVMPNPVYGSQIQLQIEIEKTEPVNISVYNLSGDIVYSFKQVVVAGSNRFIVPVDKLKPGLYYMQIQSKTLKKKSTFIKM